MAAQPYEDNEDGADLPTALIIPLNPLAVVPRLRFNVGATEDTRFSPFPFCLKSTPIQASSIEWQHRMLLLVTGHTWMERS